MPLDHKHTQHIPRFARFCTQSHREMTEFERWKNWFKWKQGKTLYDTLNIVFCAFFKLPCVGNRRKLHDGSYGDFEWITFEELWTLANVTRRRSCAVVPYEN